MDKDILNIKLMDEPIVSSCNSKKTSQSIELGNGWKGYGSQYPQLKYTPWREDELYDV